MYSTLPRSLKQDLLVKSRIEEPGILAERRAIVASKSVSELSQITSISDIPIPTTLSRVFHKSMEMLSGLKTPKQEDDESDIRPITPGARSITENMYASLPRSLKSELLVKTCVEDPEIQQERKALTESKSVSELSQIKSLSDIPIPENIEKLISRTATNKTETPEQQRTSSAVDESPMTLPRSKKEFQEAMYRTLPPSLTQPCVVRSKVEDPNILIERQQLQQTKSIHELSKIRNLNEVPIPGNLVTLPDVPLPKIKNILNYIARPAQKTPKTPNGTKSETYHSYESAQSETVESTPLTEDKVFHSMSNGNESPSGSLSNDKELGYEVISKTPEVPQIIATPPEEFKVQPQIVERTPTPPPPEEEEDHFSLADQIKGTPERSMRNKKKIILV